MPALVGRRQPDLVLVNDDDLTYAKIRLDERSLATLVAHVGDFEESLPRTLCWTAAWDMTRDAEMPARDYVATVLAGIGGESDIGVVQSLLRQVQAALTQFAVARVGADRTRPARRGRASQAVHASEPGSDLQLAWARALGSVARSDEQVALLRGLLDGSTQVPGLAVDTDLRWHLLMRLVALGRRRVTRRSRLELERDRTSAGERHAATARALRPTARGQGARPGGWPSRTSRCPTPCRRPSSQASPIPSSCELLQAWVEPYFDVVGRVWESRTAEFAQTVAVGLYPSLLVSPEVVERTDAYLAADDVPPALARLLLEGRDGVARALRARAAGRRRGMSGRPAGEPPLRPAERPRPPRTPQDVRRPPAAGAGRLVDGLGGGVGVGAVQAVGAAGHDGAAVVGDRQRLAAAGGVGDLPHGVDDAAGQVAAAEGARHRQHGEGADPVGDAAADGRTGDDLDPALAGRDDEQHGARAALAEGGVQPLAGRPELREVLQLEVAHQHGDVEAVLGPGGLDGLLDPLLLTRR